MEETGFKEGNSAASSIVLGITRTAKVVGSIDRTHGYSTSSQAKRRKRKEKEKEDTYMVGCYCVERVGLVEEVGRRAGTICRPRTLLEVGGRLDKTRARGSRLRLRSGH